MSQSVPPPQPQPQPGPADANPYAQQPGANPYAAQPGAVPPPPAPPAPSKDNIALGLVAALGAAVVAAGIYGLVIGLTKHEIGWAAVGVGFVIGVAAGKLGGRNPALAVVSPVLALGSVYIGQLVGDAMIIADTFGRSFNEVFFQHFDVVQEAWKADADPLTFVFLAIAAWAAFSGARKAAA
ncbi:hypothetical protein [Streptomyces sp. HUAS TT20]|uniref:hypothetical protein n=1 Tax=Streptomyces sp. HUAS TT20 TaxID=3447509 RepID=UPI0021D948B8|nr:hypothetical protein [Streptomyces sp. HUAS 15-9]UXY29383.1 hypothetical protein N8I87_24365 [Streptomyces sp. HUAS 15-9]